MGIGQSHLKEIVDAMEDFEQFYQDVLQHYFGVLSRTGYMDNNTTNSVVALSAIYTLLDKFSIYLEDEDLFYIEKALNCLADGCMIGYIGFQTPSTLFHRTLLNAKFRVNETKTSVRNDENSQTRFTEEDTLRRH